MEFFMVGWERFELSANWLRVNCSTAELPALLAASKPTRPFVPHGRLRFVAARLKIKLFIRPLIQFDFGKPKAWTTNKP